MHHQPCCGAGQRSWHHVERTGSGFGTRSSGSLISPLPSRKGPATNGMSMTGWCLSDPPCLMPSLGCWTTFGVTRGRVAHDTVKSSARLLCPRERVHEFPGWDAQHVHDTVMGPSVSFIITFLPVFCLNYFTFKYRNCRLHDHRHLNRVFFFASRVFVCLFCLEQRHNEHVEVWNVENYLHIFFICIHVQMLKFDQSSTTYFFLCDLLNVNMSVCICVFVYV